MLHSAIDLGQAPEIQDMLDAYQADRERFPGAERRTAPVIDDNPFYVRDYSQCVLCWRCVQVCAEDAQYTIALTFSERGFHTQISTAFDVPMPASSCVLRAVRGRVPDRRAEAKDRMGTRTGLVMGSDPGGDAAREEIAAP